MAEEAQMRFAAPTLTSQQFAKHILGLSFQYMATTIYEIFQTQFLKGQVVFHGTFLLIGISVTAPIQEEGPQRTGSAYLMEVWTTHHALEA